jgi:beta-1,4-mannosyl-glycoprotein beta-1,4-N-acetylglucosaminyltransferase
MLDFRLHHVYDHVDKIVIVESDRTYAGKPCESNLIKHWDRYKWAKDKIIHSMVGLKSHPVDRWQNEAIQRNGFLQGLDIKDDDVVFLSCVDEIIRTDLYDLITAPVSACLVLDTYYYYFNGKDVGTNPKHPMPIVFSGPCQYPHELWNDRHQLLTIPDAGWHFSYLGGVDMIKQKLEAFSHIEYDTDDVKDNLVDNIVEGRDIFGRPDHEFEFVPIDDSFPTYLIHNQYKYRDFIHET